MPPYAQASRNTAATISCMQGLMGPGALLDTPREVPLAAHDIPVFLYTTRAYALATHTACAPVEVIHGAGCGLTREAALISAVGEALERASAWRCCSAGTLRCTARELGNSCVPLERFALYTTSQYAQPHFHFRPPQETAVLEWVTAWSWTQQRLLYVPSCFVYQSPCNPAHCLFHTVSTGLACGTTAAAAILAGLCEVIERDAVMIAWLNGLELPRLAPPIGEPTLAELYRRLAQGHMQATVLDATTDIALPVRLALVTNRAGAPLEGAVGMAAHPDPLLAHRKALLEAIHTLSWLHQLQQRRPPFSPPMLAAPLYTFEDHVFLYGHPWAQAALAMWQCGPWREESPWGTYPELPPHQHLQRLVAHLGALGLDVLTVDVTRPEVAAAGFHVFRTLMPGMMPLTVGPDLCLGGTRLRTVPAAVGWQARYGPEHWNPAPHPFP